MEIARAAKKAMERRGRICTFGTNRKTSRHHSTTHSCRWRGCELSPTGLDPRRSSAALPVLRSDRRLTQNLRPFDFAQGTPSACAVGCILSPLRGLRAFSVGRRLSAALPRWGWRLGRIRCGARTSGVEARVPSVMALYGAAGSAPFPVCAVPAGIGSSFCHLPRTCVRGYCMSPLRGWFPSAFAHPRLAPLAAFFRRFAAARVFCWAKALGSGFR
jgi:hypothetical protein